MRLSLHIGIPDEDNKQQVMLRRPWTIKSFLAWVDSSPYSTSVKEKFRHLVVTMPATSYQFVFDNMNQYISRFEEEILIEQVGEAMPMIACDDYIQKDLTQILETLERNHDKISKEADQETEEISHEESDIQTAKSKD